MKPGCNLFPVADNTKTPAEAALAVVSAIARKVEEFEQQLARLDKTEKQQKALHGLSATPSFKASQDGRTVPRPSRDVFKQLAAIKKGELEKAEPFIQTAEAGDPAKRIKMVGKANDVEAGKDLPIEQKTVKATPDMSKPPTMSNPSPSPKGAVAAPTPTAPKAPVPSSAAQKCEVGVFKQLKKCGQVSVAKGVK